MRRLKQSLILAAAVGVLFVCADIALAQVPSSGYIFLEATDQSDKPVFSAAAVVYDESGNEVGSSATDKQGKVSLLQNRSDKKKYIFRVIKSGYLTYEGVFETSGQYNRVTINIKLVSASSPEPQTGGMPRTLLSWTATRQKRRNYHEAKSEIRPPGLGGRTSILVGARGFEPPTSRSQTEHSAKT
jgi:hypothetical protein